ncbi:unnamed protein product [Ophioblennius macclurei]
MKAIVWCVFVLAAVSAAQKVVVTRVGKTAILNCETNTGGFLSWYQGDRLIVRANRKTGSSSRGTAPLTQRSSVTQDTMLKITGVTEDDAGMITCTADSKPQKFLLLVLSISVPPSGVLQLGGEARLQCQVRGLEQGTPVQWKRPDGQLSGSQEVHLKPVAASDEGIWQCVFTHRSGTHSEDVTIKVEDIKLKPTTNAPVTKSGSKANQSDSGAVDHPAGGDALLLGLSWWIWVAISVGCLVLLLLSVFAIVLCQRIKRRKRKRFLKKKNVPKPLRPRKYCECNRPTAAAKPRQGRRREKPSALPL